MRLFYHAFTVTSLSFVKDELDREFWQSVLPRIATGHDYVMDGSLAVAALHLASLEPERSSQWLETALTYQNSAITGLSRHLATSEQNYEAEDPKMVELHKTTLEKLHSLRLTIDELQDPHQEIYRSTHDLLLKAIEGWPTEDSISWPIEIGDLYVDLLKQGDWMARIMLLFHGLSMHLMSRKWFARGSGRRLVLGILQPLEGDVPPEWLDLTQWIREAVDI
ncbi:hypothetical protein PoHVEF18_003692 [Penicillium ochrochloron]